MTDPVASAGDARVDATLSDRVAKLHWGVRVAADDDWLIFLDVARNRYRAIKRDTAPQIAGVAAPGLVDADGESAWRALAQAGLVAAPSSQSAATRAFDAANARLGDVLSLACTALWARRIVQRGALLEAFGALSAAKARVSRGPGDLDRALHVYARFATARIWIPARYVCLFDSLCLMRVLLSESLSADLVFGVRGRPFAAHCWVECEGEILDDGGEACASFVEIVRV